MLPRRSTPFFASSESEEEPEPVVEYDSEVEEFDKLKRKWCAEKDPVAKTELYYKVQNLEVDYAVKHGVYDAL